MQLIVVIALLAPGSVLCEDTIPVVGLLVTHARVDEPIFDYLRAGLREHGYVEGRNIKLEIVTAEGELSRLPDLARELLARKAEVILAPNEASTRAALQATSTVPIVMVGALGYDPVKVGFINSFAKPGRNVTGAYGMWSEVEVKLIEILKEVLPGATVVAVIFEPQYGRDSIPRLRRAARSFDLRLIPIETRERADLSAAFETAEIESADAVMHLTSPLFWLQSKHLVSLSYESGLALFSPFEHMAKEGALISYGADSGAAWRRAAYYVDRLLKGESASELPVEQTSTLIFIVNLKTANALRIAIPQSIYLRADKVIE